MGGCQDGLKKLRGTDFEASEGPGAVVAWRKEVCVQVLGVEAQAAAAAAANSGDSEGAEEVPADSGTLWEDPATGGAGLKCWPRWLHKGRRRHS